MSAPTTTEMFANLERYYSGAESRPEVLQEGLEWYQDHHRDIVSMQDLVPAVDPDRLVWAAAVLSPRTHWETLMKDMRGWLKDRDNGMRVLGRNREWAEEILATGGPLPDLPTQPKVTNFGRALLGDPRAVTIDSWMVKALGWPEKRLTLEEYQTMVRVTTHAAALYDITPRDFQAVVWVSIRNTKD